MAAGWTIEKFEAYDDFMIYERVVWQENDRKQEVEDLWCDYRFNLQAYLKYDDRWIEPYRSPGECLP